MLTEETPHGVCSGVYRSKSIYNIFMILAMEIANVLETVFENIVLDLLNQLSCLIFISTE